MAAKSRGPFAPRPDGHVGSGEKRPGERREHLAALGGALCATGAAILGAIPLALGLGTLAVVGLKMGG